MSYTWTNGELITAEKLNETGGSGGGVLFIDFLCDEGEPRCELDKTWQEIYDAFTSGVVCIKRRIDEEYNMSSWRMIIGVDFDCFADPPVYYVRFSDNDDLTCNSPNERPFAYYD